MDWQPDARNRRLRKKRQRDNSESYGLRETDAINRVQWKMRMKRDLWLRKTSVWKFLKKKKTQDKSPNMMHIKVKFAGIYRVHNYTAGIWNSNAKKSAYANVTKFCMYDTIIMGV